MFILYYYYYSVYFDWEKQNTYKGINFLVERLGILPSFHIYIFHFIYIWASFPGPPPLSYF